uniref:Hypothetical conserved protein n=1 Tax=uncultured Planctomycetota bacterium TaxID=120965 RepID=H5SFQ3_9BACT|nr:hypothetical conserved protein [uncultured Planctomycetota bacterium]
MTVPIGHSLCGGWIKPAVRVETPLRALGLVLVGDEPPVVLLALDWCGLCNDAHVRMREVLAKAANTTSERVAIHTVHQHNAPFVDLTAQREVAKYLDLPPIFDVGWWENITAQLAQHVQESMRHLEKVTDIGFGQARVEQVASNRRVVGPDGKLKYWRGSSCKDPQARAEPEGTIDPFLKTLIFWSGARRLATVHYYATHPMSYYGDGVVNSDFVGLARDRCAREDGTPHLYFTGCAGNVAAGKYNDGAPQNRPLLAERLYRAMRLAEKKAERLPVSSWHWRTRAVVLPPRSDTDTARLRAGIADRKQPVAVRNRSAMKLSYRLRAEAKVPIILSRLILHDKVSVLHLPAEAFVEYQLYAQELVPGHFLAVAAYGDDGPWYIPLRRSFAEGGYEPSVAFAEPDCEDIFKQAIASLLQASPSPPQ